VTITRQVRGEKRKGLHEGAQAELGPKMPVPQPELGNEDGIFREWFSEPKRVVDTQVRSYENTKN
jgi:hypothetical protein